MERRWGLFGLGGHRTHMLEAFGRVLVSRYEDEDLNVPAYHVVLSTASGNPVAANRGGAGPADNLLLAGRIVAENSCRRRVVAVVEDVSDWQVGDRVFAPWEEEWLYPGTVLFIDEDVAFVRFDDGDRAIIPLDELYSVGIRVGDEVFCRRDRDVMDYHPARVLAVSDEGLKVRYLDDGAGDVVPISHCRLPTPE